jgi:hypothetical protein
VVFVDDEVNGDTVEGVMGGENGFDEGSFTGALSMLVAMLLSENEICLPAIPHVIRTMGRSSPALRSSCGDMSVRTVESTFGCAIAYHTLVNWESFLARSEDFRCL